MNKILLTCIMCWATLVCAAQGSFSDIHVVQRIDGSGMVDIFFTLTAEDTLYDIYVEVSFDGGGTYTPIPPLYLDSAAGISPGENRHIIWDGLGSFPNTYSTEAKLKLITNVEVDCPSSVTDIDGNVYGTALIGTQCWMAENLRTTRYSNAEPIDYPGANNQAWENNTSGAYAWYENSTSWKPLYGALYNFHAATNANGLCPEGWHVADSADWTTLGLYLGGSDFAGGRMKSTQTEPDPHPRWDSPNYGATNDSGWTGFPGGFRSHTGDFGSLGQNGLWWATTSLAGCFTWDISYEEELLFITPDYPFGSGLSIRCVKN
jgi:uncharacterized protein (TIGR02145 family)